MLFSKNNKPAAPANKASDLNTAIGWIVSRKLADLPIALKGRADEFRTAIEAGEIKQVYIWYVHNLPSSANVKNELKTVENTAKIALGEIAGGKNINIFTEELGSSELEKLYRQAERTIIVTDTFTTFVADAIEISSPDWKTVVTMVSARWIYDLFVQYGADLFSANLRGYLGSRISDSNINNGIKGTAETEPDNFFVYNNGITALVVDFQIGKKTKKGKRLSIDGISIVNGAQTTGSIGSLGHVPAEEMLVPIRFVKVSKDKISNNIVRFNNSQNKLQAADFRSNDSIQDRLRNEFMKIPDAEYEGGRRGGASDVIKRSKFSLPSYTVGQSLAAFHGDPVIAYDKKSEIWTNENLYRRIFTDRTSAKHIVFCYSLLEEINTRKIELAQRFRKNPESLTQSEKDNLAFLNKKGAPYLLMHVISLSMETILNKPITNNSDLSFGDNISPQKGKKFWVPVVDLMLSLSTQLDGAFSRGRISNEAIAKAVPTFIALIGSLKSIHKQTFAEFAKLVKFTN
ncbi:AIPR family protein [Rhizobium laguerreae]|uniref:AIPR family protein n=1 Tax=Rhizobium laguerreae TaxID=1076926 RepID=UPI001C8FB208|nr:AIPR family protein [Rhizobium laguerreae]MBY3441306.1 hypothetical protein [Rhizobium laguerreae]